MSGRLKQGRRSDALRHQGFLGHGLLRALPVAMVLCGGSLAAYYFFDPAERQGGGTLVGYTLGVIGTVLILWLTALGLRKRIINDGAWSLKAWVSAHVYLGLSLIVIGTLHTGFDFGWNIHTLAYGLMLLVIASGIFGVVVYKFLPAELSRNRAQMTEKQMLQAIKDLDRQIHDQAQPLSNTQAAMARLSLEDHEIGGGFWRRLLGLHGGCGTAKALSRLGRASGGATPAQEAALSQVEVLLRRKSEALAKARRHIQLRTVLESWLYLHVPATFALLAALATHIISVFFYA